MFAEYSSMPDPNRHAGLRRAVEALSGSAKAGFAVARVPAPARRAELLMRLEPERDASYWAEPGGYEHVGLGAVATLSAAGAERFAHISEQARRLFADLAGDGRGLRLFGGFAFQAGRAASESWQAFGEGRFTLPRISYERTGDDAQLLLLLSAQELADAGATEGAIQAAARVLDALSQTVEEPDSRSGAPELDERPDAEFVGLIQQIRESIERGELEKVVLARRVGVTLPGPMDAARVLRRLSAIAPECVRFAFRAGGSTFLGATPERLVDKRGTAFETEAVAGSIRMGEAPLRLMESQKERAEQAIVVREVKKTLEPLAEFIDHAPVPEIHRLKHLAHLRTRIRGTLRSELHVLELVERLHPTPAVGGFPRARALSWIAEHEPDERGWYAGPIGWFDAAGDGEFAVALRSGLFSGKAGALYAGAGIVEGSDAASELAETRWKLAALLGALEVGA
jgi:menaquinone-specific isochorismate synthase